jgi:hypothetical protein
MRWRMYRDAGRLGCWTMNLDFILEKGNLAKRDVRDMALPVVCRWNDSVCVCVCTHICYWW